MSETGTVRKEPLVRVNEEPGFILHSRAYSESSVIAEIFTRRYGRVSVLAKGARKAGSKLSASLLAFVPLTVGFSGRTELKTLTKADWAGTDSPVTGAALMTGFYLNELVLKFLAREDPHPGVFDCYCETLAKLAASPDSEAPLRRFELTLLRETGIACDLSVEAGGEKPVSDAGVYVVDPQAGPVPAARAASLSGPAVSGRTLLDMVEGVFERAETLSESKLLMRQLIAFHLGGTSLNTRRIAMDLRDF